MLQLALVFGFISGIFARTPELGSCPLVVTLENFEVNKFFGQWYESHRSILNFFEADSKCVKIAFSKNDTNTINIVKNRISLITGKESSLIGIATLDAEKCESYNLGCSKYLYKLPLPLVGDFELPYWILDTDYNSYAIVYSCLQKFNVHVKYVWILTREKYPSGTVLAAAQAALHKSGLHKVPTIAVDHKNCTN